MGENLADGWDSSTLILTLSWDLLFGMQAISNFTSSGVTGL